MTVCILISEKFKATAESNLTYSGSWAFREPNEYLSTSPDILDCIIDLSLIRFDTLPRLLNAPLQPTNTATNDTARSVGNEYDLESGR